MTRWAFPQYEIAGAVEITLSDNHADGFITNTYALRASQRLHDAVYTTSLIVSRAVIDDLPFHDGLVVVLVARLAVWRHPDHNPMPHIEPFPRLGRLQRWWARR